MNMDNLTQAENELLYNIMTGGQLVANRKELKLRKIIDTILWRVVIKYVIHINGII